MKTKKLTTFLMVAILLCLLPFTASAENNVNVVFNGVSQNYDIPTVIQNGRTLVSAEDIFATLNIGYQYDAENKEITASTEDYSVTLTIDSETAAGTRKNYTLDVTTQIIDDVIMVPLRFVAEQLGYKVGWVGDNSTVTIDDYNLIPDVPDSEGKAAAIKRARQLTEFTFTPLKDIPTAFTSKEYGVFEAGKEYKGFPYSSAEANDKFLCENVSFETFLSALSNPDSVIYNKDLFDDYGASYYGLVCNGLARYSLGIEARVSTQTFLQIPGMNVIAPEQGFTVNDIQICDVLHRYGNGGSHVAFITGVFRDEKGDVLKVEVSEAVRPTCRRRIFTAEDFYEHFAKYKLCRYENVDATPFNEEDDKLLFESGLEKQKPMVAVDYGNKSNYFYGDETVISVFAEGENTVQIIRDNEIVEEIPVNGYTKITRTFEKGYYIVKLLNTEHFTEFCVCRPELTHTYENNVLKLQASSGDPESEIMHMEFRTKGNKIGPLTIPMIELTEEEKTTGLIERTVTDENSGSYKVSFKNKYGIWTHKFIMFTPKSEQ